MAIIFFVAKTCSASQCSFHIAVIDRGSWEQCFKDLRNKIWDLVKVFDLLRMKLVNGRHLQACLYMRCDYSAHDNRVKVHWEVEEEDKERSA